MHPTKDIVIVYNYCTTFFILLQVLWLGTVLNLCGWIEQGHATCENLCCDSSLIAVEFFELIELL